MVTLNIGLLSKVSLRKIYLAQLLTLGLSVTYTLLAITNIKIVLAREHSLADQSDSFKLKYKERKKKDTRHLDKSQEQNPF